MRKKVVNIISTCMLLVFMAGNMPEYLHSLIYAHHDTIDLVFKPGKFVFEKKHIHCSFLNFEYAPFINTEKQVISFKEVAEHNNYLLPIYFGYHFNTSKVISLRGPPVRSWLFFWLVTTISSSYSLLFKLNSRGIFYKTHCTVVHTAIYYISM